MATSKKPRKSRPSALACKRRGRALAKKRTASAGKSLAACRRPAKRASVRNGSPSKAATLRSLDSFARAYLEAALWSSTDNADDRGGEPLDRNYGPEDIESKTLAKQNASDIGGESSLAGHDFWLSRNGHGSGFFDNDDTFGADEAERLQEAAEAFGNFDLYVHRGRIYGSRG
jgi:hypothetical protein